MSIRTFREKRDRINTPASNAAVSIRNGSITPTATAIRPRLDIAPDTFEFCLAPGSLSGARGRLPHPTGGWIDIQWQQKGGNIEYSCRADVTVLIRHPDGTSRKIEPHCETHWQILQ